ncbi:MAG: BspA family leucine-rich repeat surface protein [Spirochaetia bacterium]|nr:BspA family leucine-rich repeat surface protein [Spirochaetia bacterium]
MKAKVSYISAIICLITLVFFCILACDNGSMSDSASSKSSDLVKVSLTVEDGSSGPQKAISIDTGDLRYLYKAVPQWNDHTRPISGSTNNQFVQIPGYDSSAPTPLGYFTSGQWVFYVQVLNGSTPIYEGHSEVSISAAQSSITVPVSKIIQGAVPGVVSIEVTAPTINNTDELTIAWDGTASETGAAVQGSEIVSGSPAGGITTFTYEKSNLPVGIYTFTLTHNNTNGRSGAIAVDIRQGEMVVISGCLDNGEWQLARISLKFHSVSIDIYDWGTVPDPYYGDVDIDVNYTVSGDKVSVATRPFDGDQVSELTVTSDHGSHEQVEYTRVGDLYTFNMPDDDVTVNVTFTQAATSGQVDVTLFRAVVQTLYFEYKNVADHIDFCKAPIPNQIIPISLGDVDICYDNVTDPSNPKICWYCPGDMVLSAGSLADLFGRGLKYRSIDMGGIDASAITNMSGMFEGCTNLSNVSLANFTTNTTNGVNMASMFQNCTNLTTANLNLTGFNTSMATSMASMFQGCTNLATLDLSGFDAGNAADMSSMFEGCTGLTSVTLPVISSPSINVNMAGLFKDCIGLTTLNGLSTFKTNKATSLAGMFQGCTTLASLDLSNFNASSATDISEMFQGCTTLSSLRLSNFNASSVTDMSDMFRDCTNLVRLYLDEFTVNDDENIEVDMQGLFRGCVKLRGNDINVLDLSSFDTSRVNDMSYMFCGCKALTQIDLSSFVTTNVTDMSYMFSSVDSGTADSASNKMNLTSLDVSGFRTPKVTNMTHMFYMCSNNGLTTLDVSNFNTQNVTDMSYMFGCWSGAPSYVTEFDLRGWNFSNVTTVNRMFDRCQSAEIRFPEVRTNWERIEDMLYLFSHCFKMTRAKLKIIIATWDFSRHNNPTALAALFGNAEDSDTKPEKEPSNRLIGNDMKYDKHQILNGADFDTRDIYPTHSNNSLITNLYLGGDISTYMYQRLTTNPLNYSPPTP